MQMDSCLFMCSVQVRWKGSEFCIFASTMW